MAHDFPLPLQIFMKKHFLLLFWRISLRAAEIVDFLFIACKSVIVSMNKTIDVQTRFVSENKVLALSSQFVIDLCNASQRSYLP